MNSGTKSISEARLRILEKQFLREMSETEGSVSIEDLVERTDADDKAEAKRVLRRILNNSQVTTTPDWEYKLASHVKGHV